MIEKSNLTEAQRHGENIMSMDLLIENVRTKVLLRRMAKAAWDKAYDGRNDDYEWWSKNEVYLRTHLCRCERMIIEAAELVADYRPDADSFPNPTQAFNNLRESIGDAYADVDPVKLVKELRDDD